MSARGYASKFSLLPRAGLLFRTGPDGIDVIGKSFIFRAPKVAPAPTKFVDVVSGADGNNGSSGAPWKSVPYAVQMLAAGDVLSITAPATTPGRGRIATTVDGTAESPIVWRGASGKAYLANSRDISHGSPIGNLIENGNSEAWLSASSLYGATVTGDPIAKESTIKHSGNHSIKATKTATNIVVSYFVRYLPADTEHDFSFWYRDANTTGYVTYQIMERAATRRYLQADGSWSTSSYTFALSNSGGEWAQASVRFRSGVYQYYEFAIKNGYVATKYFDDCSLTPVIDQYTWEQHSGDVYKISTGLRTVTVAGVCRASDWSVRGMDALAYGEIVSSLAACESTPGSFYYAGSGVLYYHLAVGEDISTLHIEAEDTKISSENKHINLSNDYYELYDIASFLGCDANIITTAGKNIDFYRVNSWGARLCGFLLSGTHYLEQCDSRYTDDEDCYQVTAGTSRLWNCTAAYGNDDNYQVVLNGTMYCDFCLGEYAGRQNLPDSSNFVSEGAGANMYLKNCVSYGSAGRGISAGDAINVSVINCASLGNADGDFHRSSLNQTSFVHTNNIGATKNSAWTLDATESLADPKFVDPENGDFRLQSSSPCIGAGTKTALTGTADLYDAAGIKIYDGTLQIPDGPFIDGVDIGAFAHIVGEKYYLALSIVSGTGPADWVVKLPAAPHIISILGLDSTWFDAAGVPKEVAFSDLGDDVKIFDGAKGQVVIYAADMSAKADKIHRVIGD